MTGQILLHQFTCQVESDIPIVDLAMACIFVAGKVEECHRRARDVVNVFYWILHRLEDPTHHRFALLGYVSDEYYRWRDRLTKMEMILLRELAFRVQPWHPAGLVVNYLRALEIEDQKLAQLSVNYMNDGMASVACICYQPPVMACAAIGLAVSDLSVNLPDNPPWFEVFDVKKLEMVHCMQLINDVYSISLDVSLFLAPTKDVESTEFPDPKRAKTPSS